MKKYTIKSIVKKENNKAVVKYFRGESTSLLKTSRAIYTNKAGQQTFLFKGIELFIEFDNTGHASKIEVSKIYDEKVKLTDADRIDNINLEIEIDNEVEEDIVSSIKKKVVVPSNDPTIIRHEKYEQIKMCVDSEVPVYLYGPAGSGKNHVLQQIAEDLGLEFFFTNSVQQEYKLTGFIDAGGTFHETEFYKAFKNGGLFFLDEMDASIPEVLVLLNAALANGYFEFPNGKIFAHKEFRVVSAGNTVGTGADEEYVGRLQLDQATLDRFAMIEFDYDKNIEMAIAKGNKELVDFIRDMRKQAKDKGIKATFSYRSISMVQKLEGKMIVSEVIKIAVVKGMDMDTIKTFTTSPNNKYSKALWWITNNKQKA